MAHSRSRLETIAFAALWIAACGSADRELPAVATAPPSTLDAEAVSGSYEVEGVTVQARSGLQRKISGTLDLHVEGGRYEASFELATTAPTTRREVPVQVRGSGRGFAVGSVLTGTTEEWMSLVPPDGGIEAIQLDGVELPERAGIGIVSTSQASFDEDGALHIRLENYPAKGQSYDESMTVLVGRRRAEAGR